MKFLLALLPAVALCQLGVPGGVVDNSAVKETDEPVVFAIQAAATTLAATTQLGAEHFKLLELTNARTQVVAGENLFLTLKMTGDYFCNVTVWFRAWLQGAERLQVTDGPTCAKRQARRQMVGGVSEQMALPDASTTDDLEQGVLQALGIAANTYAVQTNAQSNNMYCTILGDTAGVQYTKQLTAGETFVFTNVPMVSSSCTKNQGNCQDLSACQVNHAGAAQTCTFTVQWQAWMKPAFTVSKMECA